MTEAAVWAQVVAELGWTGRDRVNLAETLLDRHLARANPALVWEGKSGAQRSLSFADLATASARHANLLRALGLTAGDRVAVVLPRVPEALVAMLGAFRVGAVHLPIFSGFGAEAIGRRIADAGARVVVTHADVLDRLPTSWAHPVRVLVVGGDYEALLAAQPTAFANEPRRRSDPAVLLFTSGSTGPPKAVAIATNFPAAVWPALRTASDLRADDRYWPTGDPGWGYGLICYVVALALGITSHMWEAAPTPDATLGFLARHGITNLATVPTLLRGLMALGEDAMRYPGIVLRSVASCGEPLNAECVTTFRRAWGVTPLDQFGSSEHGLPIGNSYATREQVRPGSMGRPLPGQRIAIVDEAGTPLPQGSTGLIATQPPADAVYALGYWNNPEAERGLRRNGWIVTGDMGHVDADSFYWFEGRADDVIKSAGYRIGPFEVESALLTHPAVAEAAVIGKPDAARGALIKAFVVLRPGFSADDALRDALAATARRDVGAHAYPREIEFVTELPKTTTGKIQRFILRQQETKGDSA
jgi:acetyl-CoA synthetase